MIPFLPRRVRALSVSFSPEAPRADVDQGASDKKKSCAVAKVARGLSVPQTTMQCHLCACLCDGWVDLPSCLGPHFSLQPLQRVRSTFSPCTRGRAVLSGSVSS